MVLATVPAAPPTRKNQRATSWPAPISAKVPYLLGSRLSASAFCVREPSDARPWLAIVCEQVRDCNPHTVFLMVMLRQLAESPTPDLRHYQQDME